MDKFDKLLELMDTPAYKDEYINNFFKENPQWQNQLSPLG